MTILRKGKADLISDGETGNLACVCAYGVFPLSVTISHPSVSGLQFVLLMGELQVQLASFGMTLCSHTYDMLGCIVPKHGGKQNLSVLVAASSLLNKVI